MVNWWSMIPPPVLDPRSDVPLYRQLSRHFTDLILSGRLPAGEKLPATRELAGLLGLNRTTVSAAYELLEADGMISAQVGRGSFVTGHQTALTPPLDWENLLAGSPPYSGPSPGRAAISFATSRPAEQLFP